MLTSLLRRNDIITPLLFTRAAAEFAKLNALQVRICGSVHASKTQITVRIYSAYTDTIKRVKQQGSLIQNVQILPLWVTSITNPVATKSSFSSLIHFEGPLDDFISSQCLPKL